MDWQAHFREFVTLFVVIDPIGTLPVYLFATANVPARVMGIVLATVAVDAVLGGLEALELIGLPSPGSIGAPG